MEACLLHLAKEYASPVMNPAAPVLEPERDRICLGKIFELSVHTIRDWAGIEGNTLPAGRIRIPDSFAPRYRAMLLTRIDVYGDSGLLDHESSLNLPQSFPGKPVLGGGEEWQFHYRLGSEPGLVCERIR